MVILRISCELRWVDGCGWYDCCAVLLLGLLLADRSRLPEDFRSAHLDCAYCRASVCIRWCVFGGVGVTVLCWCVGVMVLC